MINGYVLVLQNNERALEQAVERQPVSVLVDANNIKFMLCTGVRNKMLSEIVIEIRIS